MNIEASGKAKVFRNEHDGYNGTWYSYTASISRKDRDGEWENCNIELRFRRNNEPDFKGDTNHTDIIIDKGFLTFRNYTDKDGNKRKPLYVMVMDWHYENAIPDEYRDIDEGLDDLPW